MSVQVSYPGVYLEEFEPGAPIVGVSTSTAAFIGPAKTGDIRVPEKITSFDQFKSVFGDLPVSGFFLWYAVKGFFDNGGQVCYVVRASDGENATNDLTNGASLPLATLIAAQPGTSGNNIQVAAAAVHRLTTANTKLYQPTGSYTVLTTRSVQLSSAAEAAQFRAGDWVNLGGSDARVRVVSVSTDTMRLGNDLSAAVNSTGSIQLADAPAGTSTFRIVSSTPVPTGALVAGTVLTLSQAGTSASQVVDAVQSEQLATTPVVTTYRVTFREGLLIPFSMSSAATVQSEEFSITVTPGGGAPTIYDNLSIDSAHPRYFFRIINDDDTGQIRVKLKEPPPSTPLPNSLPSGSITLGQAPGQPGKNETLVLSAQDYLDALDTLRAIDDANIVAIPDAVTLKDSAGKPDSTGIAIVHQGVIAHCELLADRFGVLDPEPALPLFGGTTAAPRGITDQRTGLDSSRGYAALYYPWVRVEHAGGGEPVLVPPSGHICGHIAWTDINRGVFKAPAGIEATVNGAVEVETLMSNIDQGQLNLVGVNVIHVFKTGSRPIIWGARTTATGVDSNWQYVNIRRLFLFLEKSIQQGIRWAVFEPNTYSLWQRLKQSISEFLREQWREGALFGKKEEEAFYVRIDDVLNPFSEQQLGRLHIEIGVRPSYPAEFIIVRIGIWDGGQQVEELS